MANYFINYKFVKFYKKYDCEYFEKNIKLFNISATFNLNIRYKGIKTLNFIIIIKALITQIII